MGENGEGGGSFGGNHIKSFGAPTSLSPPRTEMRGDDESAPPLIESYLCIGAGAPLEPVPPTPGIDTPDDATWLDAAYEPAVLLQYSPRTPPAPSAAVAAFCMPRSVRLQLSAAPPSFACFVLTQQDGTRLYGHCLTVHEKLSRGTTVVPMKPPAQSARGSNEADAEAEATAAASAAAPTVGELIADDELDCYAPRCHCFLSRTHQPLAFKACLLALHTMAESTRSSKGGSALLTLPVEACLSHAVLNIPCPVPGGPTVRFSLGNGAAPLHVGCAPLSQLPAVDYSVCELLRRLTPHVLMRLYHYALLEQQIVVICDDDELRLAACELLLALLHPLEWAQVYVPTVPDHLLGLVGNPFPCVLGLTAEQAKALPLPRPEAMALLHIGGAPAEGAEAATGAPAATLEAPAGQLPPLPSREAMALLSALQGVAEHAQQHQQHQQPEQQQGQQGPPSPMLSPATTLPSVVALMYSNVWDSATADGGGAADGGALSGDAAAPAMLEARTRGAFLRFLVSLLRDLHRFVPEQPPSRGMGWEEESALLDAGIERFIKAAPSTSQPFLSEFTKTQLFLSFVQPPLPAAADAAALDVGDGGGGGGSGGGGGGGGQHRRGGPCFQLVRDAFLERELSCAVREEREHGKDPLPVSVELLGVKAVGGGGGGGAGASAPTASGGGAASLSPRAAAAVAATSEVYEVGAPQMAAAMALRAEGYTYPDGLPTSLDDDRLAKRLPVPPFEGQLPPPPKVSASVRAAWAEALAELESRQERRRGAQLAAGVGGGLIIGGAAAAMLCTLQ